MLNLRVRPALPFSAVQSHPPSKSCSTQTQTRSLCDPDSMTCAQPRQYISRSTQNTFLHMLLEGPEAISSTLARTTPSALPPSRGPARAQQLLLVNPPLSLTHLPCPPTPHRPPGPSTRKRQRAPHPPLRPIATPHAMERLESS